MKPLYWEKSKKYLKKQDPVLRKIMEETSPEESLTRSKDSFSVLAKSIAGQQLSVQAADSVWRRFLALVREPTPENVLQFPVEDLRAQGFSYRKCEYIHHLSEFFLTGKGKQLDSLSDEEVRKELVGIKGIGNWTVDMFFIFYFNHPDIFPIGDLGVLKAINRLYFEDEKQSADVYLRLSEQWKPYRTVASWYLWRHLDNEPVQY